MKIIKLIYIFLLLQLTFQIHVPKQEEKRPNINYEYHINELFQDLQIDPIFNNLPHSLPNINKQPTKLNQEDPRKTDLKHIVKRFIQSDPVINDTLIVETQKQQNIDDPIIKRSILIETQTEENIDYISNIKSKESHLSFKGFLFYSSITLVLILSMYLRDWIQENSSSLTFQIFLGCIKDVFLLIPLISLLFIVNYIIASKTRKQINVLGLLDFVDLDKFLIQILLFILIHIFIAISFSLIHRGQEARLLSLESNVGQQEVILRQYENLFLYQQKSHKLFDLQRKLQYLVMRQSFITPSFQITIIPQFQRQDFNYAQYISKCSGKIYVSLMRISLVSLITLIIILTSYTFIIYLFEFNYKYYNFYLICIFFPILLMIILHQFNKKQLWIESQLFHQIDSPYSFQLNQKEIEIHPYSNVDKIPEPQYLNTQVSSGPRGNQQMLYIMNSKSLTIQLLHIIMIIQFLWYIWIYFGYLKSDSILHYSVCSISIAISTCNLLLFIPNIISLLATNQNIYGQTSRKSLYSIIKQKKQSQQEFFEKIFHSLRGDHYQSKSVQRSSIRQSRQSKSFTQDQDFFSMTEGQIKILQNAFVQTIQEINILTNIELEELKSAKNEQPQLEVKKMDKKDELEVEVEDEEEDEESSESNILSHSSKSVKAKVKKPNIFINVDEKKTSIVQDEQQQPLFSEDTLLHLSDIPLVTILCGGNMKPWYYMIFTETFMKMSRVDDSIKFTDLVEYSGFNQYVFEMGIEKFLKDLFQEKFGDKLIVSPQELQSILSQGQIISQTEINYYLLTIRQLNPNKIEIQLDQMLNFLLDQIMCYPL